MIDADGVVRVEPRWEREVRRLTVEMRLAGRVQGLRDGMAVQTTGAGRTRGWKGYHGTIRYVEGDQIHVDMDERSGLGEVVFRAEELRPRTHRVCPCGICTWELEHHQ